MKLPFLNNKPKTEYFLALVLRDDRINAFIFEQQENTIKIVNSQEESFSDSLDKTSYEDLLDAADKVISQAEDELNLAKEVQKTIFGLKESWVKDGKIKSEYLQILKKLSDSLGLAPVGFLTVSEAVVSLLQKEEGAPPSAILVDVGKNNVTVASVRAGKVVEVKTAEIHQSPVFTVDTLLKHFEIVEILPAKVILLNEDEELVQEFIGHQWSKSLPFLHLPQIVSLESDSIGKAFVFGLANQTGAKVLDQFDKAEEPEVQKEPEPVEEENNEPEEPVGENVEPAKVVEQPTEPPVEEVHSNILPATNGLKFVDTPDFFGFTKKDVAKAEPPKPEVAPEPQVFEEIPEDVAIEETKRELLPAAVLIMLPKLKNFLIELLSKVKILKISNFPNIRGPRLFVFIPFAFILLFIIYYLFFLKANVILSITPKVIEKTQDVNFSTDPSDFKNNTIKGDLLTQSEDGTASTNTTGKKETGDKAKGIVNIFNFSNAKVTFLAKSKLTSSNSLGFLTATDVVIASRSADSPGKTSVNVEAEKFGTEYNLPSSTSFTSSNSDISAKNDNPFSGGTKKEIQVVSKEDVSKIQDDLIKSLEEKAKSDVLEKLSKGKDLLTDFTDETLDKKSLDKNVDDEAKSVKLTGTVSYEFLSYDKDELINYLKTVISSNQSIDKENLELKFEDIKKTEGKVVAKMTAKIKIVPKIDKESIAKKITGKSFDKARSEILTSQINDVEIKFFPNLGFLPKFLPRFSKNINIRILEE